MERVSTFQLLLAGLLSASAGCASPEMLLWADDKYASPDEEILLAPGASVSVTTRSDRVIWITAVIPGGPDHVPVKAFQATPDVSGIVDVRCEYHECKLRARAAGRVHVRFRGRVEGLRSWNVEQTLRVRVARPSPTFGWFEQPPVLLEGVPVKVRVFMEPFAGSSTMSLDEFLPGAHALNGDQYNLWTTWNPNRDPRVPKPLADVPVSPRADQIEADCSLEGECALFAIVGDVRVDLRKLAPNNLVVEATLAPGSEKRCTFSVGAVEGMPARTTTLHEPRFTLRPLKDSPTGTCVAELHVQLGPVDYTSTAEAATATE
ncbi:MAG: hypothetical protein R3A78_05830 [Polyangiales bacterium]